MKITTEVLQEKRACPEARKKFLQLFPSGSVIVTQGLCLQYAHEFDFNWASREFLSAPAFAEYQKARALAFAEYLKVLDLALSEYQKASAPAWAEYHKVDDKALSEYKKACAPALSEYKKACVLAFYRGTRVKKGKVYG